MPATWLDRVDTIVVGSSLALVTTVVITVALSVGTELAGWANTVEDDAMFVLPTEAIVSESALDERTVSAVGG